MRGMIDEALKGKPVQEFVRCWAEREGRESRPTQQADAHTYPHAQHSTYEFGPFMVPHLH